MEIKAKAKEMTDDLRKVEERDVKRFMLETDPHFKMTCDQEKDYQMLKFVADKCFRVGYRRGMVAVFDAMEKYRAGQLEKN